MRRYYDDFAALSSRSVRDGERREREALRRGRIAIYSSAWAAEGARTGGIPSIVRHSLTGVLLMKDASAADYAAAMTRLFEDEALYRRMAMAAYDEYKGRLNWPIACQSAMQVPLAEPIGPDGSSEAATGATSTGE
jgi:hypothetical protein